jgi:hypothetical protein
VIIPTWALETILEEIEQRQRRRRLLLMLILTLTLVMLGCDREIGRERVKTWEYEGTASCHYTGVCYSCAPQLGFDGKFGVKCGFGASFGCDGTRPARLRGVIDLIRYESGATREWITSTVIERWGVCK